MAIFLPSLVGGGAERVMLNLIEGLKERGCKVDLVIVTREGEYLARLPGGINLVNLDRPRMLLSLRRLVQYLRNREPDLLISSLGHSNLVALVARRLAAVKTRVIVTEHLALTREPSGFTDRAFRLLAKRLYPGADAIVAVSEGVAKTIVEVLRIPATMTHVIYNPVLTHDFWQKVSEPPEHPWLTDGGPPVVLAVGRLTAQKDFPNLIRAFSTLRRRRLARLLILGEGPDRKALENLIKDLSLKEYVSMPGFTENPYAHMARAAVFALSSVREGLPTVLIEALAAGAAVVSTDCESGPREILKEGRLGRLVPVRDHVALAEAIADTLDEQRPAGGEERWDAYTPRVAAERYLQIAVREA